MEAVIYMAREFLGAMKPRSSADEDASVKPFRAVVACGSTVIRSDVIVTIRAVRGNADLDADLRLCVGRGSREADGTNGAQKYKCKYAHKLLHPLERAGSKFVSGGTARVITSTPKKPQVKACAT
jgi:hypothetical protein